MKTTVVLTTINSPRPRIDDWFDLTGNKTIVIGDKKTPDNWSRDSCNYLSLESSGIKRYKFANSCPQNHYCRKNLGYLTAISNGVERIIDTDDDNFPICDKWRPLLDSKFEASLIESKKKITFKNIYSFFSKKKQPFWPRGYPLSEILNPDSFINEDEVIEKCDKRRIGVWQCMVEGDPDIDAIHRLIFKDTPLFYERTPLIFNSNNVCPFNSQNTFWVERKAFPLLYLPVTVNFRFTDILRSYIAQIILSKCNYKLGFYPVTSSQERNEHDHMSDFKSEIGMYASTLEFVESIEISTSTNLSMNDNLYNCYSELVRKKLTTDDEIKFVECWLNDLDKFL